MKKSIIFDLDNTLIHSDKAYEFALKECQIDLLIYNKARENVKTVLTQKYFSTSSRNRLLYFKEYLSLRGGSYSALEVLQVYEDYEEKMLQCLAEQVVKLNRQEFLRKLALRADLYILTNENLKTQLAKISVLDPQGQVFKGILTSEEFGFEKPDIGIFEHLVAKYNLNIRDCLMIGDDYENDIKPAIKLGMQAIQTTEFIQGASPTGHVIVNDLNKVLEFV